MQLKDEKRRFKRYRKETPVIVLKGNERYELRLLDYSPVGVRIKTRPVFTPGESLELIIDRHHLKGRVAWVFGDNTGISIDGPVIGELNSYRLWDLLIGLKRCCKTGVLELTSNEIKKAIYIKSGEPIFARSNIEDERLGEFLLKKGLISLDAYNHSVELMKKTGKRQGIVLVEAGYLKVEDLPKVVVAQVEEIIKNAFKLFTGSFEFKEGPLPTAEIITLRLSLANLIYRGIEGIDSFQFIRSEIGDLNGVPALSEDPYALFQDISLDEDDRRILSLVDGKKTINDILKHSEMPHFETLKTIYGLLCTGIIQLGTLSHRDSQDPEGEGTVSMDDILRGHDIDESFLNEVNELYKNCDSMTHYEILGLSSNASQSELKKAYYSLVKKYHPDRYFRLRHDELKGKLSTIFARINHAYTILSDAQKRAEYDSQFLKSTSDKKESKVDSAQERFEKGYELYLSRVYDEAVTLFGQAVYLDSSKPKYHFYYGLALREVGRFKDAEKAILKAIELWPQNADYVAELGYLYLRLEMKLRARKTFERALSIEPENKKAKEGIALCL